MRRHALRIECFGDTAEVAVLTNDARAAEAALGEARRRLCEWHDRLTRFEPGSELSRLNADPRGEVPASGTMLAFAAAVPYAGRLSGGLVDATLIGDLERAGYDRSRRDDPRAPRRPAGPPVAVAGRAGLDAALTGPARPHPARRWALVGGDEARRRVRRPPGVRLDSGGLAKGLAADDVARALAGFPRFTIDCCGDLRLGGADLRTWGVDVTDPAGGDPVAVLAVPNGTAVATSGITRRAWRRSPGTGRHSGIGHHLIDPAAGEPAFTGVLQATALAPTALEAEVRAKAALLAGPDTGPSHLVHGGVLVLAGGRVVVSSSRPPASEEADSKAAA